MSERGPSILPAQDRSVTQKPHWGFHCCATAASCFPKNTKNPNPFPIGKKFGFCCCGVPLWTRTLGPLIKRNQRATIVNFQNCANSLLSSFHRKFVFCIRCILCTRHPLLHPLSSRSGVQKVCKNVQSQNQPLKTGIGFLCKAGKTAGFEPETAATILPV